MLQGPFFGGALPCGMLDSNRCGMRSATSTTTGDYAPERRHLSCFQTEIVPGPDVLCGSPLVLFQQVVLKWWNAAPIRRSATAAEDSIQQATVDPPEAVNGGTQYFRGRPANKGLCTLPVVEVRATLRRTADLFLGFFPRFHFRLGRPRARFTLDAVVPHVRQPGPCLRMDTG